MRRSALASFTALVIAFATLSAVPAVAQTIDLSWNACSPITVDWTAHAGAKVTAYASAFGQSQAHKAYEVWWVIGDAESRIPDAWRFDAAGCNGGFYEFSPQPASGLAKSCPPLVPAATQQFVIAQYQFAPAALGFANTMGNGFLAVSYPTGSTSTNPATRYHAVRFTFDFTFAVEGPGAAGSTCGGLERPLTLRIVPERAAWLDLDEVQHEWQLGNSTLTVNGGADPNTASTWGTIKGQYRK